MESFLRHPAEGTARFGVLAAFLSVAPKYRIGAAVFCFCLAASAHAIAGDRPVTLQALIAATVSRHPLVLSAGAEASAGESDIEAARRHWWPTLSATVESSSHSISSSANRAIQLEQTLWDGGQINAMIDQARAGSSKSEARLAWQKQQLALQVVAGWQSLLAARDKILIAEQTMTRLRNYEAQMRRRVQVQASPVIDLELVLSRLRQTEVDLSSARTNLRVAARRLEQLSGLPRLAESPEALPQWPEEDLIERLVSPLLKVDLAVAARESVAVRVARGDVEVANAQLESKLAQRWPTVYLRINKPLGDSVSDVSTDRGPAFFVGMRYTPGAGFATGMEAEALRARVTAVDESVEANYREQLELMATDREEFTAALGQRVALEGAVAGSAQVLESYSRQFNAGRKTWIDLLNAVRELAQNQFAQADARAAMTSAFYRMQVRQGRLDLQPSLQ